MTEPIRIVEGEPWFHRCLRLPGHEGEPTGIWMHGCGCCYCGQPGLDEQKKIDAVSAETLRASK